MRQYVIALDFGYPMNLRRRSSIDDLVDFIVRNYADEPETVVLAQEFVYVKLRWCDFPQERLFEVDTGQSSAASTKSGGSYHMLRETARMLERLGARPFDWVPATMMVNGREKIRATVVAHALHVGRAIKQGRLFGMELTAAEGLPTALYQNAAQWWCRSRPGWYLREIIGFIPLWLTGQI